MNSANIVIHNDTPAWKTERPRHTEQWTLMHLFLQMDMDAQQLGAFQTTAWRLTVFTTGGLHNCPVSLQKLEESLESVGQEWNMICWLFY